MESKTDIKGLRKQSRDRVRDLFQKQNIVDEEKTGAKPDQFLALLKSRYGYSNDKAVVELKRLLKQFYTMNKSLGIHRDRLISKRPHVGKSGDSLPGDEEDLRTSRQRRNA